MTAIALTIAGSDSGGGAGIQADLKAMSALGVYGASVITAVTAQNTKAVTAVQGIDLPVIAAQIAAVREDLDVGAIKIGMLASSEIIQTVVDGLAGFTGPVVVDPVMVAKSGDTLLADEAVETLRRILVPRARLLTPNLPEAAKLTGQPEAEDAETMIAQGRALCDLGAQAVLMKGGHAKGADCLDILLESKGGITRLSAQRRETRNTHGTGCTLSAAIAACLAKGLPLVEAVTEAHGYLQGAIGAADRLSVGQGHGPVHHFHAIWEG
ncbi:MAG: bifunctional hydroxymethylpyrimidine kinase/phosphomethylpyrimidine kinase [Pseudomonadota bacterium]